MKYVKLCHLGTTFEEDQRAARGEDGHVYLYDWSGYNPDLTDDRPCRIDLIRAALVGISSVGVPVLCNDQKHYVGVCTRNFSKLLKIVPDLQYTFDEDVNTLAKVLNELALDGTEDIPEVFRSMQNS